MKIIDTISIIDTHVHLEEVENLDEALLNARQAGVSAIIAVGSDYTSNKKIIELSKGIKILKIYPALGIHPTNIKLAEVEDTIKFIEENISEIIAIGEIGLDYWFKSVRKNQEACRMQRKVFELQLDLARKYSKPVILHSRGAWQECYEIVKNRNIEKVVFHWYSGPVDILERILQSGYFVSATPALEYSSQHRAVIEQSPIEKIIVETDSPVRYKTTTGETYIAEPKDVLKTITALSFVKNINFDEIVNITTQNAKKLFSI